MTYEAPDNYPGYEHDLNTGVPVSLSRVVGCVREGVTMQRAGFDHTTGSMGLDAMDREVFATIRDSTGIGQTFWVTGVRLLPETEGDRSLAGAIELIIEDGDAAQLRAAQEEDRRHAERILNDFAAQLAIVACGRGVTNQWREYVPLARNILRASAAELGISPAIANCL